MGMLDRFRRAPKAEPIAAAAVRSHSGERMDRAATETRATGEAWEVWRMVPEIHYATHQQARLVGRLDWTLTQDGAEEPMSTEDSDAVLDAAFGANRRDLAVTAALHLEVAGAYTLARTKPEDNESWRILSFPPTADDKKLLETSDVVIEVRNEDPKDRRRTDSPVLACMDLARELILLRAQARAQARSRTAQLGLLVYPSDGLGGKAPATFEAELQDIITAPLADERTTASVTPNLVGMPKEFVKEWNKLDLSGDMDEKITEKIDRLIRQIAVALDSPPEILLGFGDSNHWSTWGIQEDNWLGHVEPLAAPIGRGFAAALFDMLGMVIAVTPDPGPLLQRRPTTADALAAQAAGLVSDDWVREQLGADETDAPEIAEQDPAVVAALEMVKTAPSLAQAPGLPVLVEQIRSVLNGTPLPSGATPAPEAPAAAEPTAVAAALRLALPAPVTAAVAAPDARALAAIDTQAYDAVEDLATDTADRCMERLGAKVRAMSRGRELPDLPNSELAAAYEGPIPNADQAVADTIAAAIPRLDRIIARAFARVRSEGVEVTPDEDDLESARALFASLLADMVADRLESRPTLAAAWQTSRRVVALAGGNGDPALLVAS